MPSKHFDYQQIMRGDVQQMSALFAAAARAIPDPKSTETFADFDRIAALAANAQPVRLNNIQELLPKGAALAPALQIRLMAAENLFTALFRDCQLDNVLQGELEHLSNGFLRLCSSDDSFYCNPDHPARQLVEEITQRGATWYPRDSKPSQLLYEKLQQLTQAAGAAWSATPLEPLVPTLEKFRHWAASEDKRAQLLETRLCESELAGMKLLAAECRVLDLINNSLAGKALPVAIIEQLPLLKSELQHCLINDGTHAAFWKIWQRTLPLLGKVFSAGEDDVDEQQLYRDIPLLLAELESSAHRDRVAADHYQDFIDTLARVLMQAIQKQAIECQHLPALIYPEGYTDSNTRVTESILQQGKAITPGEWILFHGEDQQMIRCKLALKIPDSDQLLFVDHSGRKVMIKNIKDFSLCLSTGVAHVLQKMTATEVIENVLKKLITHGDQYAEQQRRDERLKGELIFAAKRVAAEKALAEARQLAEQKQRREQAAQALEQKNAQEQQAARAAEKIAREKSTLALVNALNVGAWIEIETEANQTIEKMRCKLSVMIGSTGKYIFVDHLGRKAAEYQRNQLIQAINDEKIKVISKGDKFEDQLIKVIRGLRKDIS